MLFVTVCNALSKEEVSLHTFTHSTLVKLSCTCIDAAASLAGVIWLDLWKDLCATL